MKKLLLIVFTCFISSLAISQNANIQIKVFLEGLYDNNGTMKPAPFAANGSTPSTIADTVVVELHGSAIPCLIKHSCKTTLNINGIANCSFPNSIIGNSYYIVINHRNSNETWSANPVLISSSNTSYDFSLSASKAFGNNLQNMGNGVFAIFVGDINQDGAIDFNDYNSLDVSSNNGDLGYNSTDLNGDASTDFNDYPVLDINSNNGVFTNSPPTILNIGDTYGGGKIAYILQSSDAGFVLGEIHGIIVSENEISNSIQWHNGSYFNIGATSSIIGSGNTNTNTIVSAYNGSGNPNFAAKLCFDLVLNGFDDWYLPSLNELNMIYLNKLLIGGFWNNSYWSSTEDGMFSAWYHDFGYSSSNINFKSTHYAVRAVRSF